MEDLFLIQLADWIEDSRMETTGGPFPSNHPLRKLGCVHCISGAAMDSHPPAQRIDFPLCRWIHYQGLPIWKGPKEVPFKLSKPCYCANNYPLASVMYIFLQREKKDKEKITLKQQYTNHNWIHKKRKTVKNEKGLIKRLLRWSFADGKIGYLAG